jgi:predicted nuclease of restriction endonuclease-like (RecB) superfamily
MSEDRIEYNSYGAFLPVVRERVQTARIRANLSANRELLELYWDIGRMIAARQNLEGWGSAVIKQLSTDIQREFPDLKGFSERNIWRMRSFYIAQGEGLTKLPTALAQIPWAHNILLVEKVKNPAARLWYVRQTIEHGWSRNMLSIHIEQQDYERKGHAVTNFEQTLPSPQSDLAQEVLKDPYLFDFLGIADDARERDVERSLVLHLRDFLLELGSGFAFVGNQVRLEIDDEDYYIDLLFYHLKLRCYFVIDLKTRPFAVEDAGKMNFYLNAVDDLMCHPDDRPSVGLVLCREKKGSRRMTLEYALRGLEKPIGISGYQLTRDLPSDLKSSFPSVEDIENEIAGKVDADDHSDIGIMVKVLVSKYPTKRDVE